MNQNQTTKQEDDFTECPKCESNLEKIAAHCYECEECGWNNDPFDTNQAADLFDTCCEDCDNVDPTPEDDGSLPSCPTCGKVVEQ